MPKYAKLRPLLDPLRKGFGHEDPELIRIVREKYLIKPSNPRVPYRLNVPSGYDSSMGQALKVREIFNDMVSTFKLVNNDLITPNFALEKWIFH